MEPILTPLEITAWALGGLALLASLWLLTAYRSRVAGVGAAIRRQTAEPCNPDPKGAEGVSVIVVAGDDARALDQLLGKIFDQEWQPEMEVVVVNDGKNPDIKDVVTRRKHLEHRPNLLITFTPPGIRNISRRKLAVTLGIKAAHNPVIILLDGHSRLYSTQWLARMAGPFTDPRVELVIGSALPSAKFDSGLGRRYRSFTHGADAAAWLSAALRGKPWRGHRANLAFRRELFFASGGFNSALNLNDGDDDIFVSKVARRGNSVAVVAPQAAVRYSSPSSRSEMRSGRPRRMFTERNLRRSGAGLWGFSSLMAWTLTLSSLGAIGLGIWLRDWVIAGIAAALLALTWTLVSLTWRKTLKALRCRPVAAMAWPMILRRPLTNLRHSLRSRRNRAEYRTTPA